MVSTFTTNKGYEKQGTGDNPGAWGPPLNANFDIIDKNLGGTLSLALSSSDVTLSAGQAQNLNYILTGAISTNININWPAVGGIYNIYNNTTGSYTVTLKNTGVGASVVAPQGFKVTVWSNGTDTYVFDVVPGNLSITGNLTVGGSTTFTAPISFSPPGGRLTLTSNTPVMSSDVSGAATIYYTPYLNGFASFFDGTTWNQKTFSQLSQALSDNTKSPAATLANNLYDMFLWDDGGTIRCTRGPAWNSSTDRGTGPGTTQISVGTNGVYFNTVAITNGPAAGRGIYVGTIYTNASNLVPMVMNPLPASGGTNNFLGVWNMYNRVPVNAVVRDSTVSWIVTSTGWRSWNNSANNRFTLVSGLNSTIVSAKFVGFSILSNNGPFYFSIGLDSVSSPASDSVYQGYTNFPAGSHLSLSASFSGFSGLGLHFLQMLENTNTGTGATVYGASQLGMSATMEM